MAESPKPSGAGGVTPAVGSVAPDTDRDPDRRLRAALEATTRAEASLTALMHAVEQVTTGVSGAQEANERLTVELATARELLAAANEQRLALEQRAEALEQERQFMQEQQDRFFAGLVAEHDEQLAALRREIHELRSHGGERVPPAEKKTLPGVPRAPQPDAEVSNLRAELGSLLAERQRSRELMRRVQAQRDEAQELAHKLGRECAEAKSEIERLSLQLRSPPELSAELGAESSLRQPQQQLTGRRTEPQQWTPADPLIDLHQRATAPPSADALEAALLASRKPSPPPLPLLDPGCTVETTISGPPPTPLLRKHDPHRRTVGGYSVRPEQVEPERIATRPASKPPRG